MRLVRYAADNCIGYGRLEGNNVRPLAGPPWEGLAAIDAARPLETVQLLAPIKPSKIIALGLNYRAHAQEAGMDLPEEPLIFSKAPSAVIGPGEPIIIPAWAGRVDYEAELAVVIGRETRNIEPARAKEAILGLTALNDVTARKLQAKDGQWTRAKSFDTFCPLGPWIETDLEPDDLSVRAELNDRLVQDGRTSDLIFPVPVLIAHISRVMTLYPGDVIATGTPAGVGPIEDGDTIVIEIEGVGRLSNPVRAAEN